MKILICSDIHGDIECTKKVIDAFDIEGADRIIILGDILYHGPRNDLPDHYAPKEVIKLLNSYSDKIFALCGNCDAEVDAMVLDFAINQGFIHTDFDGIPVMLTHGHKHNTEHPDELKKGEILLHGHTHIPKIQHFGDGNVYINPGSVTIPKENNPKSYLIYSDGVFTVKDFDGNMLFEHKAK